MNRGDPYQLAVAQVAKSLYPTANVDVGTWIDGPDGRRDLDVTVRAALSDTPSMVIECKDWKRPIGIALIDALDSKRRDIGVPLALICSNSGFTADALRKAARVGIPALAALIEGDGRVRVAVRQQIYTRKVQFVSSKATLWPLDGVYRNEVAAAQTSEFMYEGRSFDRWVANKCLSLCGMAPGSRRVRMRYRFREPIIFQVRGIDVPITMVEIGASFTVQWCTQEVQVGASSGMYDYLRQLVITGPGAQNLLLRGVNVEAWESVPIEDVPPSVLIALEQGIESKVTGFFFAALEGLPGSPTDPPNLDPFVEEHGIRDDDRPPDA